MIVHRNKREYFMIDGKKEDEEKAVTKKHRDLANLANIIVNGIIADLISRGGLDDMWDSIADDVKNEIEKEWNDIVYAELVRTDI